MNKITRIFGLILVLVLISAVGYSKNIVVVVYEFHPFDKQLQVNQIHYPLQKEIISDLNDIKQGIDAKIPDPRKRLLDFKYPKKHKFSSKTLLKISKMNKGSHLIILGSYKTSKDKSIKLLVQFLNPRTSSIIHKMKLKSDENKIHVSAHTIAQESIKIINQNGIGGKRINISEKLNKRLNLGNTTTYQAYQALIDMIEAYKNGDHKKAILYNEKVLYIDPNYTKALENLGKLHEKLGYHYLAMNYYKAFLDRSIKKFGREKLMSLYYKMAQQHDLLNQYELSLSYYQSALNIEKTFNDPKSLADKHFYIGISHYKTGDYNKAEENFQQAINIYNNENASVNSAKVNEALGYILLKKGDYKKSIDRFESALKVFEGLNDKLSSAKIYTMLGRAYSEDKKDNKAITFFGMALNYWKKVKHKPGMILTYLNLGKIQENQGNIKNARVFYQKGLEESQSMGDLNKIDVFQKLLFDETKIPDRSEYVSKLSKIENYHILQRLSSIYNNIGLFYQSQKKYKQAIKYLIKALNINERFGHKPRIVAGYNNLGILYFHQKEYKLATLYLIKALKISERLGDVFMKARCYLNLGSVFYKRNDYNKSQLSLNRSLQLRQYAGDNLGMATSYFNLAILMDKQGNKGKALDYAKKSHEIEKIYKTPNYEMTIKLLKKLGG